jgi:predicted AlkP superfamily phosphohydrolase/phosphomutase
MRNIVATAALLLLAGCAEPGREAPPPRTTLVALDGADWRNALPLLRQGKLPVLDALRRAGGSGIMLTNADYRWSPVLWTTVVTGKLPNRHGVTGFMAYNPGEGKSIPTPSTYRRCRALWNVFTERERTVGFVGWWVTWPAEKVNGFMVTDHFSITRFKLDRNFESIRNEKFSERQTYPEDLYREIEDLKYSRHDVNRDDLSRFAELDPDFVWPEKFRKFDRVSEFAIAHSVDRTHSGVGAKLLAERDPELFGVFFQGIDIMQHFNWEFMDPAGAGTNPSHAERARWGQAIERYYSYADGLVGSLIEAGGSERSILIVSDHGFQPSTERWEKKSISGEHRRQAFCLYAGPGIRRGTRIEEFDAVDVAPTVLAYHGLPVAHDMDGEPHLDAHTEAWRTLHPVEWIETYETGEWDRGDLPAESMSDDLTERIKALGYVD